MYNKVNFLPRESSSITLVEKGFGSEAVSDGHEICEGSRLATLSRSQSTQRVCYQVPPRQRLRLNTQMAFGTEVKVRLYDMNFFFHSFCRHFKLRYIEGFRPMER